MEVASCAQEVSSHAASLLACLNLQRERAQFCDCVLRQRQSPGQIYPAHRCVLAASSPVLAAILSSTGALVELQAPCLSDFVLAPLLDYVYTGALPYTHSQQLHHSLLTAACYLQMDELQEALRSWQQTEAKAADNAYAFTGAENQPHEDSIDAYRTTVNALSDLPSTSNIDAFGRLEDPSSVHRTTSSLERKAHQYSAIVETFDETHSTSIYSSINDVETATSRDNRKNGANHCGRADARAISNTSTCCSRLESSVNAGDYREVSYLTPQDLIQNIASTAEVQDTSGIGKEVQKDRFHSAGIAKPQIWQKSTEEELVRATEDRRDSSSATSSLPHPCCGAVPVICHSSRAAILQLEDVSAVPPYHPPSQAAVSSSRVPASRSASAENESFVKESSLDNITGCVSPFGCRTEKISEPSLMFTMPVDSNMSDTAFSTAGQSYRGHLHCHCLPQEDVHSSHGGSDHKYSHPSHSDHSDESNDDEEEEAGAFASPRHSSLKQHSATETTDQVLLLDIGTKPAELFVSCKHRSDTEETWVTQKDTFEMEIRNDGAQRNEPTSGAGGEVKTIGASTKFGAESSDEAEAKSKVGQANVEDRNSAGKDQSRSGAEVIQAGAVESVSNTEESENQISTWIVSAPPRVPASMPSTSSDCIPSTLSDSMPTNISAHLSTPVHHSFQCSLCDRSFSQRGSLNRHVRSHLGVRPFPCPRCPMTFSRQYRVTEHMRVHQRCALGNDFVKAPASSI